MKQLQKPFSPSCERNRGPILNILSAYLPEHKRLLEVGSGTGQHAVYFAPKFDDLTWITTDRDENHAGIKAWLDEEKASNIEGPLSFNLGADSFPATNIDVVYTANTFHIMPWEIVQELISISGANLEKGSLFIVYGPFIYDGRFTSPSNEEFHQILRQRASHQGIREFKNVNKMFEKAGFKLMEDFSMPANNQTLVFKKNR
jgi:cyclopropane fatty-acyl-phospholipid synthase-like methyltransferase